MSALSHNLVRATFGARAVHQQVGRLHLQHPGGGPGFATILRLYPQERLGIVVMANGTDLDFDGLADLLASMEW